MTVLEPLAPGPAAMYFCFDRSPHAMPLSIWLQMLGRAELKGQLLWERWNGKTFEPVRAVDETEQLLHSGCIYLFLTEPVPRASLFGAEGLRAAADLHRAPSRPAPGGGQGPAERGACGPVPPGARPAVRHRHL